MFAQDGNPEAIAIRSRLMEDFRLALTTPDFGLYLSACHLPKIVSTSDSATAFDTPADLRRVFDGHLAHLAALNVTRYEHHCIAAHFIGDAKIEAVHETRFYDTDGIAEPPSVAHSILERIDGRWGVSISRYEVAEAPILKRAFASGRALTQTEAALLGFGD